MRQQLVEIVPHLLAQRVAGVGPVQRDGGDLVLDLEQDMLQVHGLLLRAFRRQCRFRTGSQQATAGAGWPAAATALLLPDASAEGRSAMALKKGYKQMLAERSEER